MTAGFAVSAGWDLPVGDHSQVHAAVAMAGAAAAHARLVPAERAACELIATELATNLARHARDGRLVVIVDGLGHGPEAALACDAGLRCVAGWAAPETRS